MERQRHNLTAFEHRRRLPQVAAGTFFLAHDSGADFVAAAKGVAVGAHGAFRASDDPNALERRCGGSGSSHARRKSNAVPAPAGRFAQGFAVFTAPRAELSVALREIPHGSVEFTHDETRMARGEP